MRDRLIELMLDNNVVYCRIEGFSQFLKGCISQVIIHKKGYISFVVEIRGYFTQKYTQEDVGGIVFLSEEEAMQALKGNVTDTIVGKKGGMD